MSDCNISIASDVTTAKAKGKYPILTAANADTISKPSAPPNKKVHPHDLNNSLHREQQDQQQQQETSCRIQELQLGPNDVGLGRGKHMFQHPGNVRYRKLIAAQARVYTSQESRAFRKNVTNAILHQIESEGGRFLQPAGENWTLASSSFVMSKIMQALRDMSTVLEPPTRSPPQRDEDACQAPQKRPPQAMSCAAQTSTTASTTSVFLTTQQPKRLGPHALASWTLPQWRTPPRNILGHVLQQKQQLQRERDLLLGELVQRQQRRLTAVLGLQDCRLHYQYPTRPWQRPADQAVAVAIPIPGMLPASGNAAVLGWETSPYDGQYTNKNKRKREDEMNAMRSR